MRFVKMHGLGNDVMIARWPAGLAAPSTALVRQWGDRRLGVGFDQLLIVTEPAPGQAERPYRIFNHDGGEVEQCGNGVRCLAAFLAPEAGSRLELKSRGGSVEAQVQGGGLVTVSLGEPNFDPASLPFRAPERRDHYRLRLASGSVDFGAVSLGNPHAVIAVDSVELAPVGILGPEFEAHADFPLGVNVGFAELVDRTHLKLRVFERGAGETPACGTGAAAAVAVGRLWGRLDESVEVMLPGGTLTVRWQGPGTPLRQTGPTTKVYEGQIEL
ncbi:MAG TPA: diaminopimelate epimerase [Gammaproteobacteria bacterium]|nr:diaminopimelate epimerase [Gammaproteobacteria bacterium]